VKKLFIIFILLFAANIYSQGVYRNSLSYMRLEFNTQIRIADLLTRNNYIFTNSSAQRILVMQIGFDNETNYDKSCDYVILGFYKHPWGIEYNMEVVQMHDTLGTLIDPRFDNLFWSFEDQDNSKAPIVTIKSK
jgi:hypothetical protein